jgi:hypothetical protein
MKTIIITDICIQLYFAHNLYFTATFNVVLQILVNNFKSFLNLKKLKYNLVDKINIDFDNV